MKVVFRADASLAIGTGHVMRCLTLARELAARGHGCSFICRDMPGNLNPQVAAEFPLVVLDAPDGPEPAPPPDHAGWAGVDWALDAAQTRAALDGADWLVVDHYAFDARWQQAARPAGVRLLVIDDLADRVHDCDLLLDQNLGREAADYDALVPEHAERLIGPRYALLRPEFAALRDSSLRRRVDGRLLRLLVLMGGMDAEDTASDVLAGLLKVDLPPDAEIVVVLGRSAPHLADVRARASQMPYATDIRVDVTNMAALMHDCDLAISAGGLISYELTCMGLPALLVPMSAIQEKVARETVCIAEARLVDGWRSAPADRIAKAARDYLVYLRSLPPSKRLRCAAIDGQGAGRVVAALEQNG